MRTGVCKIEFAALDEINGFNDPTIANSALVENYSQLSLHANETLKTIDCNPLNSSFTIADLSNEISLFKYHLVCRIDSNESVYNLIRDYQIQPLIVKITTIKGDVFQLGTSYNPVYINQNFQTSELKGDYSGVDLSTEFLFPVIHKLVDYDGELPRGMYIVTNEDEFVLTNDNEFLIPI